MRADDIASLKKQPIGSDENSESCDDPGNDSLENGVEAHEPRKHYFFEASFSAILCSLLYILKELSQQLALRTSMEQRHVQEHRRVPQKRKAPTADKTREESIS